MTEHRDRLVLIVEDEKPMQRLLRTALGLHGYRTVEARTAAEALNLVSSQNPSLVLLDLGLPDGDGIDLTRRLREWTRVPLVVLSARGREDDKVAALDAGADDYLTKPFGVNELLARMRVALRRTEAANAPDAPVLEFGPLRLDLLRRQVFVSEREVHLTPIEYRLVCYLAKHAGRVLTHRQILGEIWGPAYTGQTHYVRVHMAELRKKLEPEPARPRLIVTEQGVGYRLKDRAEPGP